jgi:hypothetical protein
MNNIQNDVSTKEIIDVLNLCQEKIEILSKEKNELKKELYETRILLIISLIIMFFWEILG